MFLLQSSNSSGGNKGPLSLTLWEDIPRKQVPEEEEDPEEEESDEEEDEEEEEKNGTKKEEEENKENNEIGEW